MENEVRANEVSDEQSRNIVFISETLDALNLLPNSIDSNNEHPANIPYMTITLDVSKYVRSNDFNAEQSANIRYILVTFDVSNLLPNVMDSNDVHLANISYIYVVIDNSKSLRSNVFNDEQL